MDIDILQKRLEIWKHILFILVGASFTLLLQAFLNYQESGSLVYPTTWYGVWFVVQLAAFLSGFVFLWGDTGRKYHFWNGSIRFLAILP